MAAQAVGMTSSSRVRRLATSHADREQKGTYVGSNLTSLACRLVA